MLLRRTFARRNYSGTLRNFFFGRDAKGECAQQLAPVDLSNLSTEDVDIMMDKLLLNRGLNHLDCLGSMKQKFDVLSDVEKQFNLKIPSSQLNTLNNGQDIKEFILYHQQRMERAAKLFTINMTSLPANLSIKQPTLRVGPKKHNVKDPLDPDSYEHPT